MRSASIHATRLIAPMAIIFFRMMHASCQLVDLFGRADDEPDKFLRKQKVNGSSGKTKKKNRIHSITKLMGEC